LLNLTRRFHPIAMYDHPMNKNKHGIFNI